MLERKKLNFIGIMMFYYKFNYIMNALHIGNKID